MSIIAGSVHIITVSGLNIIDVLENMGQRHLALIKKKGCGTPGAEPPEAPGTTPPKRVGS